MKGNAIAYTGFWLLPSISRDMSSLYLNSQPTYPMPIEHQMAQLHHFTGVHSYIFIRSNQTRLRDVVALIVCRVSESDIKILVSVAKRSALIWYRPFRSPYMPMRMIGWLWEAGAELHLSVERERDVRHLLRAAAGDGQDRAQISLRYPLCEAAISTPR